MECFIHWIVEWATLCFPSLRHSPLRRERMVHCRSFTPATELAQRPSAKYQSDSCCSLPMNRTRKLLEMNECSKTGSWAQGAIKVRGDLSLRERVRVRGKNLVEYAKCSISQGFFSKWSPSLRAIVGLGGRGSWPLHFYCVAGLKVAG